MENTSYPPGNFRINLLTLSFPGDREKAFRENYFQNSLLQIRIALLSGICMYSIFGFLDAWLVPEAKYMLWFIRFVIFAPYLLFVVLFSFSHHFKKYMQLSLALGMLIGGLGITAMILIAPYPASHSYYAGLLLVLIYGYTFVKLRFIWASLTGWLLVIAYEIAAIWISPTPIPKRARPTFPASTSRAASSPAGRPTRSSSRTADSTVKRSSSIWSAASEHRS